MITPSSRIGTVPRRSQGVAALHHSQDSVPPDRRQDAAYAHRPAQAVPDVSIGQAARQTGVSAKMIRYYEAIGLIRPTARSAANYRSYDAASVQALRFIARSRQMGFSLQEVGRLLALWQQPGRSSAEVKRLALAHAADLGHRIALLQEMKAAVERLAERCHGDGRADCAILDGLSGMDPPAAAKETPDA